MKLSWTVNSSFWTVNSSSTTAFGRSWRDSLPFFLALPLLHELVQASLVQFAELAKCFECLGHVVAFWVLSKVEGKLLAELSHLFEDGTAHAENCLQALRNAASLRAHT